MTPSIATAATAVTVRYDMAVSFPGRTQGIVLDALIATNVIDLDQKGGVHAGATLPTPAFVLPLILSITRFPIVDVGRVFDPLAGEGSTVVKRPPTDEG
jgi:hypothetical protein